MEHEIVLQSNLKTEENSVLEDITAQIRKQTRFKRNANTTLQKVAVNADATEMAEEASTKFQTYDSRASAATIPVEPVTSLTVLTKSNSQEGVDTASALRVIESTMPLKSSYFGDLEKLLKVIIAMGGFAILLLALIAITMACNCWKRTQSVREMQGNGYSIIRCTCCIKYAVDIQEYQPLPQSDFDYQEISHNRDIMVDSTSFETTAHTDHLESLYLKDIPLVLEDYLIKKLDVRRKWQKVGTEFGIKRDDLEYLENEHRYNKSPTKQLLDTLGCQGRTTADLVNVLKSPNVNYPDIALFVQKHLTAQTC